MKRIITYCAVMILLGSILTSCFDFNNYPKSRSFIASYYDIDDIRVRVLTYSENEIWIYGTKDGERWDICNGGIQKEKYDALCEKHNDMSWYRKPYWNHVLGVDFLSISVVSDAAFDETHPAGASLADVLEFRSESIYPFIKSGYTLETELGSDYSVEISKPLSTITTDDLIMLGDGIATDSADIASLYWLSEPTLSQIHNITVTMTADDGRVFEKTVQVSWE